MSLLAQNFLAMLGMSLVCWFVLMKLKHLADWLFPKIARRLMGEARYAEALRRIDEYYKSRGLG
jgi:hypothetical protein